MSEGDWGMWSGWGGVWVVADKNGDMNKIMDEWG